MAENVNGRIEAIEKRLERIERRLKIDALAELTGQVAPESAPPMAEIPQAPLVTPIVVQKFESPTVTLHLDEENAHASAAAVEPVPMVAPAAVPTARVYVNPMTRQGVPPPLPTLGPLKAPPVPPPIQPLAAEVLPYVPAKPKKPVKQSGLEQTIGLKWAGWVGAVILLIGAALGVKYAFDQHWFAALPVWVWPSIIAAAGFALIGAGEWVYRKVNVIPGASLFGAGVATLFLVSYIGHSYYNLYSPSIAFVLMALTTLIGSAVAIRGNLVSIAVLSIIGGNIAPIVMGDSNAPHAAFMSYLLMLQVIALTLAWWGKSPRWWTLRGLSLATTSLWLAGIIGGRHDGLLPLWFGLVYAALYHGELIASALRFDRQPGKTALLRGTGTTFVALLCAFQVGTVLGVFYDATPKERASWLLALAAVYQTLQLLLRNPRRSLTSKLAPAYAACAAALIALAVPVALNGRSIEFGWAALAVVFAAIGRANGSRIAKFSAVGAWMLALSHLALTAPELNQLNNSPREVWLTIWGVQLLATTCLAWGLALVGQVIAALLSDKDVYTKNIATVLSAVATLVWVVASIVALPPLGASLCLIVYAWLMLGADVIVPKLKLAVHAIAVLLLTTVKWVAVDTLGQRLAPDWSAAKYPPVLNPMMGIGLLLAVSLVAVYWLRRNSLKAALPGQRHAPLAAGLAMAVVGLMAIAFSFEIDRVVERAVLAQSALDWPAWQVKQMGWTMLWSASACALAFALSRMVALAESRSTWLRAVAVFAALLVAKFLLVDTLIYRLTGPIGTATAVFNLQTLAAATVVGALMIVAVLVKNAKPQAASDAFWGSLIAMLALFVIAWTGTFEVERFVVLHPAIVAPWPMDQFKQMAWTCWWTICAGGGFVLARFYDRKAAAPSGVMRTLSRVIPLLAMKFAIVDALWWRITERVTLAPVLTNMQAVTAAIVLAAMIVIVTLDTPDESARPRRVRIGFMAMILAILAISLEIDRFFEGTSASTWVANPRLAKQVAFSIVWSICAVLSVAAGFRLRLASLRYFGLGLLALTLLKVVTVDLGQVSTGYRILSFLGLGLLMLGTSVLYGKLSPKLLGGPETEPSATT